MNLRRHVSAAAVWSTVVLASVLLGCAPTEDGGGAGGTGAVDRGTGTVSILFTDAPTDVFTAVNITVSRIELMPFDADDSDDDSDVDSDSDSDSDSDRPSAPATLFNGSATFDLLQLENFTNLFSITPDVPAGEYRKIRLTVSALELVERDTGTVFRPPLSSNGTLDLLSRRPFTVEPDTTLVVEIDMDARRSIHVTPDGSGYRFRPVVFVKVGVEQVSHLVQIRGVVNDIDLMNRSFEICRVDESGGGITVTDECLTAKLTDNASIFNPDGAEGGIGDLVPTELVTVLGNLDPNDVSIINVEVVERDALAAFVTLHGTVLSAPDADAVFGLTLDAGQVATDDPVVNVQLQSGTRVFNPAGDELDATAIVENAVVEVSGVLAISDTDPDTLWAEWVIVSDDGPGELDTLTGFVLSRDMSVVTLFLPADPNNPRCVRILPDADIQVVTESSTTGTTIEPGELADIDAVLGRELHLQGTEAGDGCFEAQSVMVFVVAD